MVDNKTTDNKACNLSQIKVPFNHIIEQLHNTVYKAAGEPLTKENETATLAIKSALNNTTYLNQALLDLGITPSSKVETSTLGSIEVAQVLQTIRNNTLLDLKNTYLTNNADVAKELATAAILLEGVDLTYFPELMANVAKPHESVEGLANKNMSHNLKPLLESSSNNTLKLEGKSGEVHDLLKDSSKTLQAEVQPLTPSSESLKSNITSPATTAAIEHPDSGIALTETPHIV